MRVGRLEAGGAAVLCAMVDLVCGHDRLVEVSKGRFSEVLAFVALQSILDIRGPHILFCSSCSTEDQKLVLMLPLRETNSDLPSLGLTWIHV